MNLKTLKKNKFNKEGIFFTPNSLALYLKDELFRYSKEEIKEVFDITCGDGALLKVFDDNVIKYGAELNNEFLEQCFSIPNFIGEQCDLLKTEAFKNKLFKHQVFNYPFSIKDKNINTIAFNNQFFDIKSYKDAYFILSILNKMDDNGIAVGLAFPGILYRLQEQELRKALVFSGYLREIEFIEDGEFIDTSISAVKLVFVKNKNNNSIIFKNKNKVKEVNIKDIEKEDFNLSVQTYIEDEIIKPVKPCSMLEMMESSIREIKRNIDYTNYVFEADYIAGESTKEEWGNNKKLYNNKLTNLIISQKAEDKKQE